MHSLREQSNLYYKKMSDINDLRNRMDEVTLGIIKLLKTRTDIAKEIGETYSLRHIERIMHKLGFSQIIGAVIRTCFFGERL